MPYRSGMDWFWFVASICAGIVLVLAETYRAQRKSGKNGFANVTRVQLALLALLGGVLGWWLFYYAPPVIIAAIRALPDVVRDVMRYPRLGGAFVVMAGGLYCWHFARMAGQRWMSPLGNNRDLLSALSLAAVGLGCVFVALATAIVVGQALQPSV